MVNDIKAESGTLGEINNQIDELVEKIIVRDRECLVFCLRNGMELAEGYKIKRGKDVV